MTVATPDTQQDLVIEGTFETGTVVLVRFHAIGLG